MLGIFDRYVLREVVTPFLLALLLLTFALEIPPILDQGERLMHVPEDGDASHTV